MSPTRLNEHVLLSQAENGAFKVIHGSRDDGHARYRCAGFETADAAIQWVDRLDALLTATMQSARMAAEAA